MDNNWITLEFSARKRKLYDIKRMLIKEQDKQNIPSFFSLLHGPGWSLPSVGVKMGIRESGSVQVLVMSFLAPVACGLNR